jgi:hypothetical protein
MKFSMTAIFFLSVTAGLLFCACSEEVDFNGCVPNGGIACPSIFGPVCVQKSSGAQCYEGNSCIAGAKCEQVLCNLDLDINLGGIIDPDTDCAQSHPDCLDPCP